MRRCRFVHSCRRCRVIASHREYCLQHQSVRCCRVWRAILFFRYRRLPGGPTQRYPRLSLAWLAHFTIDAQTTMRAFGPDAYTHLTLAPVQLSHVVRSTGSSSSPPLLLRRLFLIGDWPEKLLSPRSRPLLLDSDNMLKRKRRVILRAVIFTPPQTHKPQDVPGADYGRTG